MRTTPPGSLSAARPNGYRVECDVCGRAQMSGDSPLSKGWPKCCGHTMRLTDTEAFIANVDREVGAAFGVARRFLG